VVVMIAVQHNAVGAKGHYFKEIYKTRENVVIDVNLTNKPKSALKAEERVRSFQRKLYSKAKQEPEFRFYVLYDKLSLPFFLKEAWRRVKANKGAAGYDKVTFSNVIKYGVEQYLAEIAEELKTETYKAQPILRVYIPKSNGKLRPLGIPTIKDKIVQMCCKLIIESIFEADFENCSFGFRPKRSAQGAIQSIKLNLKEGRNEVYDADLSGFFDNIPHDKLILLVEQRITDKRIIKLIKQWLKAPYFEDNKLHKNKKGTPQDGVISPLLANIYLNLVDKAVKRKDGYFYKYGVRIVRYADDFILMANKIPEYCLEYLNSMLNRMELTVNQDKTKLVKATQEPFKFLGFTFRYDRDLHGRNYKYLNICPSKKSEINLRSKIKEYLRYNGHKNPRKVAKGLNPIIRGWFIYYSIRGVSYPNKSKRNIRYYLMQKLNRVYRRKSQRKCKLSHQNAYENLVKYYGLYDLSSRFG
ncbi:MAG: group II intron reverse transcriptase/maturase, partial [Candidatus Cloacimonetes bacterium]|nr:group II intron reverse transcriptase/maturase [Candidatus Cloacimonadota bacterium]